MASNLFGSIGCPPFACRADSQTVLSAHPANHAALPEGQLFFAHTERLFAFIYHSGVEPTNNISERTIRTAVQWRKICFGNRSDAGEAATARLLSAAGTFSIQKPNLLHYLPEAVRCHRQGITVPSLLPQEA